MEESHSLSELSWGRFAGPLSPGFAVSNQKRESERFSALNTRHLRGEKLVRGVWDNLPGFQAGIRLWHSRGKVNLKRHVVRKDGKGTRLLLVE